jgi:hypothetical protein
VNLISKTTSAIIHPVQTATSVAGQTMGVAAAGARTTMRIIDRAAGQVRRDSPEAWSATDPATTPDATQGATGTNASPEATLVEPAARKASAKKGAAKKAPSARAATVAPALSRNVQDSTGDDEVRTPSGIPAADEGYNPDTAETDLHQPGTEPLMDPATVKAIKSEAEVMQRAADPDKG